MRKLLILLVLFTAVSSHAAQNYNVGNFMVGFGLGAGSANVAPVGSAQMTLNPSVELIVGTWNPGNTGLALGVTVDSSVNLFGGGLTGTLAPMATFHVTMAKNVDWYTSLGMGLQMLPATGTTGAYNIHVGFQTGFNFFIHPAWVINAGMAIHANQIFGSFGFKVRFGDASKIQYRK